jgi:hypothetical protein
MSSGDPTGLARGTFWTVVGVIVGAVVTQSLIHLVVVLGEHRVGTIVDLDRSNALPDVLSTIILGGAATAAIVLVRSRSNPHRSASAALAVLLVVLTLADAVHDGAHPHTTIGKTVIGAVCGVGLLLVVVGRDAPVRCRRTMVVAGTLLATSFLVTGLDRFDVWFERERGDVVSEAQIVAKEGFELAGWSLVALALADAAAALDRRSQSTSPSRLISASSLLETAGRRLTRSG